MIITFTNVIGAIRSLGEAAQVITTNLKMWLGFETSVANQEQVVDGDFPTGTTAWTLDTGWSVADNKLNGTSAITENSQTIFASAFSRKLKITYDVVVDSGQVAVYMTDKSKDWITQSGSYTDYVTSSSINIEIDGRDSSPFTGSVTNVSVEIINQITPDKSGNNNVGELFTGKALEFDGSTTYVSANSFAGTLSNNTAFTFAVWFNSEKTLPARFFNNTLISSGGINQATNIFKIGVNPRDSTDEKSDGTVINIGGIYFDDSNGYNNVVPLSGGVNYNDGEWHRLVVSRPEGSGAQDLSFYVDGSLIGTAPCNPYWNNMTVFDFGQEWDPLGTSDHFEGNMSDIQVYDYAWTSDDVTYDYANPNKLAIDNPSTSLVVTNLKGYWALSEGDGLVAYDSGTNLEEEEVFNGDFSDGTNNWTTSNSTISIEGGALKITSTGGNRPQANQTVIGLNIGSQYKLSAVAKRGTTSNDVEIEISGIASTSTSNRNTTTEYETIFYIFTATATSHIIQAKIDEASELLGTTAYFSNISLKEVTASDHGGLINGVDHVDAQPRIPQLGMQNWSKGSNLLTYSEDFSQWTKNSGGTGIDPVLTANQTDPNNTLRATKIVFNKGTGSSSADLSVIQLNFSSQSNTASVYVRSDSAQRIMIRNSNTWQIYDITNAWVRIQKTDSGGSMQIGLREGYGVSNVPNTSTIYLYGTQVDSGSSASAYRLTDGGGTLNSTVIANPTIPTQDILGNAVRDRLNSFNLDGSGYAVVADDTDLDFGTGDFTLEYWLRIDGNTLRRLLDKRNDTSGYTLYLTDLNVLNLELNDGTGNSGFVLTSSLSSNTWLHLAIVCDRSANATCYINKAAQTPVPISSKGGNIDSTSSLFIGADAPDGLSYYSTDIISDVRLYDRVLTSDEVENNYNAGLSAHTN